MGKWKALLSDEQGQGMTEYGLVLGIISIAVIGVLALLRTEITNLFQTALDTISGRNATTTTTTP